ncbi:MAG: ECF-type sigma factor [Planctomycetota bacterium]
MEGSSNDITRLISAARDGDRSDRERLYGAVYGELLGIARRAPRVGKQGETMQPTAVVNELFIEFERRFPAPPKDQAESRRTFFQSVALAMRTILRDHERQANAAKRGGGAAKLEYDEHKTPGSTDPFDPGRFGDLDEALDRMESYNSRWHQVVMFRYFAGRTIAETASLLDIAESTVSSDWTLARRWLVREIDRGASPGSGSEAGTETGDA